MSYGSYGSNHGRSGSEVQMLAERQAQELQRQIDCQIPGAQLTGFDIHGKVGPHQDDYGKIARVKIKPF
ncbi:MAG: hypothetical protein ACD_58C00050G0005 [uncultured bacterium]|nr:MAG: hypothetical protein ACD_58C00050G0005 [uncultured bacterium]